MNAMTGAERVRVHRERKAEMVAARQFSLDYLNGHDDVTIEQFLVAKLDELYPGVQLDAAFTNRFSEVLSEYSVLPDYDSPHYQLIEMMEAWATTEADPG